MLQQKETAFFSPLTFSQLAVFVFSSFVTYLLLVSKAAVTRCVPIGWFIGGVQQGDGARGRGAGCKGKLYKWLVMYLVC